MIFGTGTMAVWIVSLMVVVSVLWLALHGWRQGRTLVTWAAKRELPAAGPGDDRADAWLEPFRRDDEQMVRRLGRVRETVEVADGVYLFRCEERVDLTPWVSGGAPSRTRIVAGFPAPEGWETYSVFDEDGEEAAEPPPGLRFADPGVARRIGGRLREPPHPLSVSMAEGRGIAYLLTPSGGVSGSDLDYLAGLACRLARLGGGRDGASAGRDDARSGARAEASPSVESHPDAEEREGGAARRQGAARIRCAGGRGPGPAPAAAARAFDAARRGT